MTKIEWADMTINPVVGCTKCSDGCRSCYAERIAARLAKNPKTAAKYDAGVVDDKGKWTGKINSVSNIEEEFCDWIHSHIPKKPFRVFVGSMTDLFHENGLGHSPLEILLDCLSCYPNHTFMLLTKRPERMKAFFADLYRYRQVQKISGSASRSATRPRPKPKSRCCSRPRRLSGLPAWSRCWGRWTSKNICTAHTNVAFPAANAWRFVTRRKCVAQNAGSPVLTTTQRGAMAVAQFAQSVVKMDVAERLKRFVLIAVTTW